MYPTLVKSVRGMAAAEFVLISIPLLLAGLGAFEAAHWHLARQAVSLALLEGARAGAVSHASPTAIERAIQKGLQPLGDTTITQQFSGGQAPWQVEILSPRSAHFTDFPGPNRNGVRTIEHAYQSLQHQRALSSGLPGGRGNGSGDTIFGANTLSLRLTYLHVPLVPGMRALLRQLGATLPDATGFAAQAMRRAGVLPIRQTVSITMQSSPWDWQHHGIVAPTARVPPPGPVASIDAVTHVPPCRGLWCDAAWSDGSGRPTAVEPLPSTPPATSMNPTTVPWDDTEQACQAALCCVEASE